MDDGSISPRRALPPVPPARPSGAVLTPPAPTVDQTTWFDPLDPMNDSMLQAPVGLLGPLDDGTAAKAARDLIRESGRQPVLDEALLEALDAAAKAAAARRAVTVDLPTGFVPVASTPVADHDVAADDSADDASADDTDTADDVGADEAVVSAPPVPVPARPAPLRPVPVRSLTARPLTAPVEVPEVDVAAEFARHDDLVGDLAGDLVETGRHATVDGDPGYDQQYDTGRHAIDRFTDSGRHLAVDADLHDDRDHDRDDDSSVGIPAVGTLTHRTVVTRSSGHRWIPVGVGAGVLSIVAAVLLTSGFAANGPTTGTDEAARTGTTTPATTEVATTPSLPAPAMNTLDLSGPVLVDDSARPDDTSVGAGSVDAGRPSTATSRSTPAVQPQVATPPSAASSSTATSPVEVSTTPSTLTAETPPPSSNSSASSSSSSASSSSSGSSTAATN